MGSRYRYYRYYRCYLQDGVQYLMQANSLIHQLEPDAKTVAQAGRAASPCPFSRFSLAFPTIFLCFPAIFVEDS